jgi:hypothetical protein
MMPRPLPIGAPLLTGPELAAPALGGGGGGTCAMIVMLEKMTRINIANVFFILVGIRIFVLFFLDFQTVYLLLNIPLHISEFSEVVILTITIPVAFAGTTVSSLSTIV